MRLAQGVTLSIVLFVSAISLWLIAVSLQSAIDSSVIGTKIFIAGFNAGRIQREWPMCVHEKWMDQCKFDGEPLRYSRDNPL